MRLFPLLASLLLLAGCGSKGDLYLPSPAQEQPKQEQPKQEQPKQEQPKPAPQPDQKQEQKQ